MAADRQAEEMISRCVSLLVFYRGLDDTQPHEPALKAEFLHIIDDIARLKIDPGLVLAGVEDGLRLRFENTAADALFQALADSFGLAFGPRKDAPRRANGQHREAGD